MYATWMNVCVFVSLFVSVSSVIAAAASIFLHSSSSLSSSSSFTSSSSFSSCSSPLPPSCSSLLPSPNVLFCHKFILPEIWWCKFLICRKSDAMSVYSARNLMSQLCRLPEMAVARRLVVPLLARFVLLDEWAVVHVLPHLLTPKGTCRFLLADIWPCLAS